MNVEKGLRRNLTSMIFERLEQRAYFTSHVLHAPIFPFPAREMLPALYMALTPASVRPETSYRMQTDFRFSIVAVFEIVGELDLLKCDAIDEIEEALLELQQDATFQASFAQINLDTIDPTPLSLSVFGFQPLILEPPVGALRMDYTVDFHYDGGS